MSLSRKISSRRLWRLARFVVVTMLVRVEVVLFATSSARPASAFLSQKFSIILKRNHICLGKGNVYEKIIYSFLGGAQRRLQSIN